MPADWRDPAVPCPKGSSPLKWSAGQPHVPVTTTYVVRAAALVEAAGQPNSNLDIVASCNSGDVATGGGYFNTWDGLRAQDEPGPVTNTGAPISPPTQWRGLFHNSATFAGVAQVNVVCQHTQ